VNPIDIKEFVGYAGSFIVAASLMMSSIFKLRLYNLAGALLFMVYGIMIQAFPVTLLNGFIAAADIFYLYNMIKTKDFFSIVEIQNDSKYLKYFMEYYYADIKENFPDYKYEIKDQTIGFYLLRNVKPAGLFLGEKIAKEVFSIKLDYVIPEYRDLKIGNYLYNESIKMFRESGYSKFEAVSATKNHDLYLKKMGFIFKYNEENKKVFEKNI